MHGPAQDLPQGPQPVYKAGSHVDPMCQKARMQLEGIRILLIKINEKGPPPHKIPAVYLL